MQAFDDVVSFLNTWVGWVLITALVLAGAVFTVRTRGVQFRLFGAMVKQAIGSRSGAGTGVSSFQAFTISLASRVGTGNIVGVALAMILGGAGAVFWMWVMALVGMATAFVEATVAQIFKLPHPDGSFRGGPAYYMQRGLGSRPMGIMFAIFLIFTFGLAFQMVQANTIAGVMSSTWQVPTWVTALVLMGLTALVVLGGIRSIARVTEWMAPLMALVYLLLAVAVIVVKLPEVPQAVLHIFESAFGLNQAVAGIEGGLLAALLNGVKRGMFSNEAGMGSAPNAAATATTRHPVEQGLIQSLGVFVDTMIVCTATAVMLILSGGFNAADMVKDQAATATQNALSAELGTWVMPVMAVLIFVFCFSSVLGNETYAEINMDFLGGRRVGEIGTRLLTIAAVGVGATWELASVWNLADLAMSLMAVSNIVAILLLGRFVIAALSDWEAKRRAGEPMSFDLDAARGVLEAVPGFTWRQTGSHPAGEWYPPEEDLEDTMLEAPRG